MIHPLPAVSRRTLLGAAASIPGAALLAGCTGDGSSAVRSGVDEVTYLTSFGLFGRDAYVFVARELGFFAESNLEVAIQPGSAAAEKLAALLSGEAQFAATDLSGAIIARGQGTTGFTTLAAVHQLSPTAFMAIDPDITRPQDLAGRTIAIPSGTVTELLWPSYAQLVGLDPDDTRIVNGNPAQLPTLLSTGQADAIDQFVMGLPTVQAAVGDREVAVFPFSDELTDLYGIALLTTTELAVDRPELCTRFRDALLRGLAYSLDHPDEAGEILAEAEESVPPEVAAAELREMDPYVRLAGVPLGALDEVRVAQSIALLEAVGAIDAGMTAGEIIDLDLAITT